MPATNMFTQAKTAVKPATKAGKPEVTPIDIEGLQEFADLKSVYDAIGTLVETAEAAVKTHMHEHFVEVAKEKHERPANFRGKEGKAQASMELRKRSSRSALNETEIELANQHKIEIEQAQAESFYFNPDVLADPKIAQAISDALAKVPSLKGLEVIRHSAPTWQVSAKGQADIFKQKPDVMEQLMPLATTQAIKPVFTAMDFEESFKRVKKKLFPKDNDEKEKE